MSASDGSYLWSFATGGNVDSSPTVASGLVYVGSEDKQLYALNATTGEHLWSYATDDWVVSSPAVSNCVVYFGSYDHLVYAVGSQSQSMKGEPEQLPIFLLSVAVTTVLLAVLLGFVLYRRKH